MRAEGTWRAWRDTEGHGETWRDMKGEETYEQPLRSASLTSPPATAFPIFFSNLVPTPKLHFLRCIVGRRLEIFGKNYSLEERLWKIWKKGFEISGGKAIWLLVNQMVALPVSVCCGFGALWTLPSSDNWPCLHLLRSNQLPHCTVLLFAKENFSRWTVLTLVAFAFSQLSSVELATNQISFCVYTCCHIGCTFDGLLFIMSHCHVFPKVSFHLIVAFLNQFVVGALWTLPRSD